MHISQQVSSVFVSPTAIGLISGGQPSLILLRGIRLAPAKKHDTEVGVFPAKRMLITCLREEEMGVGGGVLTTSRRWCTLSPEGPATVSLEKEMQGWYDVEVWLQRNRCCVGNRSYRCGTAGMLGFQQLPCMIVVFGAIPLDCKMRQAFSHMPDSQLGQLL